MAQRDGQRVGGIVRPRNVLHLQEPLRHFHNLKLFRPAVTRHRLLNLQRRIFEHREAAFFRGHEYDAPSVRHGDARRNVRVKKKLLDGQAVRLKLYDQRLKVVCDL